MTEKLLIQFSEGNSGWLKVQIHSNETIVTFTASYVPYDSIYELTKGLSTFLSVGSNQRVSWNTEPIEYDFLFSKSGDKIRFEIVEYADNRRLTGTGKTVFNITGTVDSIVVPIWRALRNLEYSDYFEQEWKHKFPHQEMKFLTDLIKRR
ncbi:MAG TPA: hypothetical protein VH186_27665 [Chloroflexia bacterium]|nr:hypothetical protein [Chloroflexia bacterium]